MFIGRVVVFTSGQSNYLKQVSVIALNVTITRARTLVHSSVLPRLLLQHVLYIDKWVHSLQRGLPLYHWRPQRELQGLIWGWAKSPGTAGGREPAALSGNLQVAKLFKALLSTFGCPSDLTVDMLSPSRKWRGILGVLYCRPREAEFRLAWPPFPKERSGWRPGSKVNQGSCHRTHERSRAAERFNVRKATSLFCEAVIHSAYSLFVLLFLVQLCRPSISFSYSNKKTFSELNLYFQACRSWKIWNIEDSS